MFICYVIFNFLMFNYSLFHFIRTEVFLKKITLKKKTKAKDLNCNLMILIPCLYEQNTIIKTIEHFENNIIHDKSIPIFLITTNVEKKTKDRKTTKEVIEEQIITKYKNVKLINYPYKKGNMASQLNYAIDVIKNDVKNFSKTYISVYNADSLPNKNTFNEFYNTVNNNYPMILQQYSYSFSNLSDLTLCLKGFAVYQSNFELKIGLLNAYFNNKLHKHVVGHGLFIRLDLLLEMGGFNSKYWCEDIYLSSYLQNKNIKIIPLLSLENMETANGLFNLIKQNGVWFKTSSQCFKIYRDLALNNNLSKNGVIALLNEFRSWISWLLFPILFIIVLIFCLVLHYYWGLIFTVSNYCFYVFAYYVTTLKIVNQLDKQSYKFDFKIYIGTLLATLMSNLGPLYSIIINPKKKHKTER